MLREEQSKTIHHLNFIEMYKQ